MRSKGLCTKNGPNILSIHKIYSFPRGVFWRTRRGGGGTGGGGRGVTQLLAFLPHECLHIHWHGPSRLRPTEKTRMPTSIPLRMAETVMTPNSVNPLLAFQPPLVPTHGPGNRRVFVFLNALLLQNERVADARAPAAAPIADQEEGTRSPESRMATGAGTNDVSAPQTEQHPSGLQLDT